jgi:hypothetical protein
MSFQLRIIGPAPTFIMRLRRHDAERVSLHRWLAIHRSPRDWTTSFSRTLDLLMEEPVILAETISFADKSGIILWRRKAFWTIIHLELKVYSHKKRQLIAAALLKTARNCTPNSKEKAHGQS